MTIALVTGTSSGIGLATAVTLARGGHTVIATMRNLESAGELQRIVAAENLPVSLAALNVDDDASVESALAQSQEFNLYYLQLQEQLAAENRQYSAMSNVLKARHDTVKNAIGNIR